MDGVQLLRKKLTPPMLVLPRRRVHSQHNLCQRFQLANELQRHFTLEMLIAGLVAQFCSLSQKPLEYLLTKEKKGTELDHP